MIGTDYADTIYASNTANEIWAGAGNDTVIGREQSDTLHGGDGNDSLNGQEGSDTLYGGAGNDILKGDRTTPTNPGDDTIDGGSGDDTIYGYGGSDTLTGGTGSDTFYYRSGDAGVDTITDFDISTDNDKLDIADMLSGFTAGVDDITEWVQITDDGTDSTLAVDADGTANGTTYVNVATLLNVTGLTDEAALVTSGNLIAA